MAKKLAESRRKTKSSSKADSQATVIWGTEVESGDFVKVPRVFLRLARYLTKSEFNELKPRHLLLILALAGRKFQRHGILAYWQELAEDLDVNKDTVRKWAYELRDKGMLNTEQHRGRPTNDHRVGYRNERNSFDIGPFVRLVEKAYKIRREDQKKFQKKSGQEADDES